MKRLIALSLLAAVMVLTACREAPSGLIVGTGTLYQRGGECGSTWLVHADSGRDYELTNLAEDFRQRDLRVRFALKKRYDVASTCMAGATADVVALARL